MIHAMIRWITQSARPGTALLPNVCAAVLLCFFLPGSLSAGDAAAPRGLSLYGGPFTDTSLQSILFRAETDYRPSYIAVLAYSMPIDSGLRVVDLEAEGQVAKHLGIMQHMEVNGVFVARKMLGRYFSVAVGEGLSYATRNPELENPRKDILGIQYREHSRPFLNYLLFEAAGRAPMMPDNMMLFIRIHHRSGAFGMYCPPTCGSNFITYGARFSI